MPYIEVAFQAPADADPADAAAAAKAALAAAVAAIEDADFTVATARVS